MNDIQYKLGIQYSKEAINRLEQTEKQKNEIPTANKSKILKFFEFGGVCLVW